jgi:hypothetical protein
MPDHVLDAENTRSKKTSSLLPEFIVVLKKVRLQG